MCAIPRSSRNLTYVQRKSRIEIAFARPVLQSSIDSGPFLCCDKIPELILRFVPMISNLMRRRMNLHRKDIGCIEDLYKDRKTDKVVPLPEDLPF